MLIDGFLKNFVNKVIEIVKIITKEATCIEDGERQCTCSLCKQTYKEIVPKFGHNYSGTITTEATCTTNGVKTYTCSRCGDTYEEVISATGHNYVDNVCTICGIGLESGLYDSYGYMIASWDNLVNDYGMDIYKNYDTSYETNASAPVRVLSDNEELSVGTLLVIDNNITKIYGSILRGCKTLSNIILPNSIETIDSYAFQGCTNLKNITIPDSVITINTYAFMNCTSLETIKIGSNVNMIGTNAFKGCKTLLNLDLGKVTTINSSAFSNCTSLSSLIIPNTVNYIGGGAFDYCSSLESVYFLHEDEMCEFSIEGKTFYKYCEPILTFYFKNSNMYNSLSSVQYNSTYSKKSHDYNWSI